MVFWVAATAVSGLSFYSSAAAATETVTDAATVSLAVDAAMAVATATDVTGLSGLFFFPASAAATIPAANQCFCLISGRLLREPIFKVIL